MVCLDNGHVIVGNESEVHEYDASKDTWDAVSEHEIPVKNFTLAAYRSRLLLVGGVVTTLTPSVLIHNIVTGAVIKPPPSKSECETDKIWHLDDRRGWIESPVSPMPSWHSNAAAVVDGDLLIVASGPGIAESNGVDIFDGKSWRPTVYVQGAPMNHIDRYSHKKYRVDMVIHNGHLYVLSEYLNIQARQIKYRFFGFVSIQSLLESSIYSTHTRKYATWMEIEFPDGYASNPISYDGHFISLVSYTPLKRKILRVFVYQESSWYHVIGNASINYAIASPCITKLPTGNLMVMIGEETFEMSIVGMFRIYNMCMSTRLLLLYMT